MTMVLAARIASAEDVRIAAQYGLGYAPLLIVAKRPELLRKYAPDANPRLLQFAGGAAVREALLSGSVDIGGLAMPPIIQAWAKGADLKIALGLNDEPAQLITWRPDLQSVHDLKQDDKVNVVSIGSPQTLVTKMAALEYFGNPNALDAHFVAIAHPDAVAAMITHRGIAAEFAAPPYIRMLLARPEMHVILGNTDFAQAGFTLIVAGAMRDFAEGKPKLYAATIAALTDAIAWLNDKPEDAAAWLSDNEPGKLSAAEWLAELKQPGVHFSGVPHGLAALTAFMAKIGMISKTGTFDDLTWPNLRGRGGS